MEGDPKFEASQEIPYVDYAAYAELIGLRGIKVTEAAEIEDAWREALSADRPVIISALTDPNEAPLPPHITFEQAEGFAKSVAADPGERRCRARSSRYARRPTSSCRGAEMRVLGQRSRRKRSAEHRIDRWVGQRRARPVRALALGTDRVCRGVSPPRRSISSTTGRASATR